MTYIPDRALLFHLRDDASNISGYKRLVFYPAAVGTEATLTGASNSSSEVLIKAWSSDALATTEIPAGYWRFNLYAKVSSATDITKIKVYVYSRNTAGTETALFNLLTAEMDNTDAALVTTLSGAQTAFTVAASDRLIVKLYAVSDSATDKTITLYYQGATNYSHVLLPNLIPVPLGNMVKEIYDADGDGVLATGGHVIQEETTPLTARANLNFTGAGVVATDNAGTDSTDVTIVGGGSGADILEIQVFT
jgi:hypothetical protein